MAAAHRRKEPLDGLRGLAALGVAIGSWAAYSIWGDAAFARNLSLLADFVLIIAGFIVARAHRDQLAASRRVGRFLFARTGRIFPLHAACLALFLATDLVVTFLNGRIHDGDAGDYLSTLFLTQIFLQPDTVWNAPSWIVAVELYMSYLFAALCIAGVMARPVGRAALVGAVVVATACRLAYFGELTPTIDLLLRGGTAFLLGALLHSFVVDDEVTRCIRRFKKRAGGWLELWALVSVGAFIAYAPPDWAPYAPFVFWYCLMIFVRKICATAEILITAPLQRLGDLSYSILLTHALLIHPLSSLQVAIGDLAPAVVTVLLPAYLILLIALAEIAFRAIELPTRRAMWSWADHAFPSAEREARSFQQQGLSQRLTARLRRVTD